MQLPTFTGMALDRADGGRKDPEWVASQLRHPRARIVRATKDGVLVADEGGTLRVARLPADLPADPPAAGRAPDPLLLGLEDGVPILAADLDGAAPAGARPATLRDAGALLPGPEAGLAAYAVALLSWHRRHRFCANCGAGTEVAEGGYTRHCPRCGAHHFPRVDPVVIMLVSRGDELLLGRQPAWPAHRYSALAGFVSPGEAAEEAVIREVREEAGVEAREPRFVASQPWPFPGSLMLGFHALAGDGGEPVPLDGELEAVRWFSRDAIERAVGEDPAAGLLLPPPIAIARYLIDRWLAERKVN